MTLRLDPRWPLVWRDPFTLQVGIDPPRIVLDSLSPTQERLLAALRVGTTRSGLMVLAEGDRDAVDDLIARVSPALATESASHPGRVVVTGEGRILDLARRLLTASGIGVHSAVHPAELTDQHPDLAVIVARGVAAPDVHAHWLRRDVPHIAVVASDTAVQVSPVVEPGLGPCLVCLELHRRDADPAWPAIATQLLTQPPRDAAPALAAEAAAAVTRVILTRLAEGPGPAGLMRITAEGARSTQVVDAHPDCGCGGLGALRSLSAVPRGIDSVDAPDRASSPTRASVGGGLS